jgi:hypothetical protein
MKKKVNGKKTRSARASMRPAYDFSKGLRGVTAARASGSNVFLVDPEVLDVFPDGRAINEALRALAPMIRHRRRRRTA